MFQTTNQNIYLTVPDELYFVHRGEGPATAAFLLRQPNLSETKGQSSGTVGVWSSFSGSKLSMFQMQEDTEDMWLC